MTELDQRAQCADHAASGPLPADWPAGQQPAHSAECMRQWASRASLCNASIYYNGGIGPLLCNLERRHAGEHLAIAASTRPVTL